MKRTLLLVAVTLSLGASAVPLSSVVAAPSRARSTSTVTPAGIGRAVVAEAIAFLGYRYTVGGASPVTGFDSAGLVSYAYRQLGIAVPLGLPAAIAAYPHVALNAILPGDILLFQTSRSGTIGHAAIYIGGDWMIHAGGAQRGVTISRLIDDPRQGNYWNERYRIALRPALSSLVARAVSSGPHATRPRHGRSRGVVTVTAARLNVRTTPALVAPIITVLSAGTRLAILQTYPRSAAFQYASWIEVKLPGSHFGWVIRGAVTESATRAGRSSRRQQARPLPVKTVSLPRGINLHSTPLITAPVIASSDGRPVRRLAWVTGWVKVELRSAAVGWVLARFVGAPAVPKAPAPIVGHAVGTAHLRTGPSLSASIMGWVQRGTQVAVLRALAGWDLVRLPGGEIGYVSASFIARGSSPAVRPVRPASSAPAPASTTAVSGRVYVVMAGDTLDAIAARFGVSPLDLIQANHLPASGLIKIGQRLVLPGAYQPGDARSLIESMAARYDVDPALALAVAWNESGFNQNLRSISGAVGIMQIEPYTAAVVTRMLGRRLNIANQYDNVLAGVYWLSYLLRFYNGDATLALAAYYEGQRNLARRGYLRGSRGYPGTQQYVANVLALRLYFASH